MIIDNICIDYEQINKRLKPCPFCGGRITVCTYKYDSADNDTEMEAGCSKCGTGFHMYGADHGFAKSAIELWNMRSEK